MSKMLQSTNIMAQNTVATKEMELVEILTNHAAEELDKESRPKEKQEQEQEQEQQNTITTKTLWTKLGKKIHGESICLVGVLIHLSYYIANFQFKGLISTLTNDLKMTLFQAVLIVNIQEGAQPLLLILIVWLADTYLGNFWTLIISVTTYSIGMAMWYSELLIIMEKYKEGQFETSFSREPIYYWGLLTVGLLLIMVGQCGYVNYTKVIFSVEKNESEVANNEKDKGSDVKEGANNHQDQDSEEQQLISRDGKDDKLAFSFYNRSKQALKELVIFLKNNWIDILGFVIAVFLFPRENTLEKMITLISMMLVSSFLFVMGKLIYHPWTKPKGSPISAIVLVLWIAFKKRHDNTRTKIYNGDNQDNSANDHEDNQISSNRFGCLNIAAMYDPTSIENPKEEFEKRRLCTVQQVGDTKIFIGCICLSLVFLTYGVMTAVADTFFLAQTDEMDTEIGNFEVPIQLFVYTSSFIKKMVSSICKWILDKKEEAPPQKRFHGALRVGFGMLLSIPCFFIAAVVEDRKTSVLWLTPQLVLVAIMDGLVVDGIDDFFKQEMPELVGRSYGCILAEGIVGLGKLLSIGWFCLWYFATDWFWYDIEGTLLHKYYTVMAIFASFSFILYVFVAYVHFFTQSQQKTSGWKITSDFCFKNHRTSLLPSESLRHRTPAKVSSGTD